MESFKLIKSLYEILSDDNKHTMYDNYKRFSLKEYSFADKSSKINKYYICY